MYCGDDVSSAVIDIGREETRAGYSGEDCPRCVIPSYLGILEGEAAQTRPRISAANEDAEMEEENKEKESKIRYITGMTEISRKRDQMKIKPLFQEGGQMNFDLLEQILAASLNKTLMLPPSETPLLFSENSIHNKEARLQLTEFLFEKYKVPAIFFCKDSVLSSFACGRSTAVVLDSGAETTTTTPVHDGYALQKCILRQNIGGNTLTRKLGEWLEQEQKKEVVPRFAIKVKHQNIDGQDQYTRTPVDCSNIDQSLYKWSQMQVLRDLKEENLICSEEPIQGQNNQVRSQMMELPDGQQVQISGQRVSIVETMFQQNSELEGFSGIQSMVVDSIGKTDVDIRRDLFSNIIITGGNTCYKNFLERLQRQIPDVASQNIRVKVIHAVEKKFTPWVGGSILSSLGSFMQMWMSRQEYEELGAIMIERKCP